nr:Chain C, peptide 12 [Escherichia coli K-12]6ZFM_F Chain F, peptide 12 [Escherichia coli K-12]
YMWDGWYM